MRIIPRKNISVSLPEFKAFIRSVKRGEVINGEDIEKFEKRFSEYIGVKYSIAVASARSGIWATLKAFGCEKGEKIIMCSYNLPAIVSLIERMGLRPVFVDMEPDTYNIDVAKIEEHIDKDTKYILATHMFSQPCELDSIKRIAKKYNMKVIEDCAHACGSEFSGSKAGSFGDAGCFSFDIGKALVAFGGGMVTTNDRELYLKIKDIVSEFRTPEKSGTIKHILLDFIMAFFTKRIPFGIFAFPASFLCVAAGHDLEDLVDGITGVDDLKYNPERSLKFSNAQAAIGIEQLKKLDHINDLRIRNSNILSENLKSLKGLKISNTRKNTKNIHLYYPLEAGEVHKLKRCLMLRGIDSKITAQTGCVFDSARQAAGPGKNNVMELPNGYALDSRDMDYIVKTIKGFAEKSV
ncbi:DegT/DnrJ/EryC1/StrS family aminotransferase [Candidatus Omnitrophota bacterium]